MSSYYLLEEAALELAKRRFPDERGQRTAAREILKTLASEIEEGKRPVFSFTGQPVSLDHPLVVLMLDWLHGREQPQPVRTELVRTGRTWSLGGMQIPEAVERPIPAAPSRPAWLALRTTLERENERNEETKEVPEKSGPKRKDRKLLRTLILEERPRGKNWEVRVQYRYRDIKKDTIGTRTIFKAAEELNAELP